MRSVKDGPDQTARRPFYSVRDDTQGQLDPKYVGSWMLYAPILGVVDCLPGFNLVIYREEVKLPDQVFRQVGSNGGQFTDRSALWSRCLVPPMFFTTTLTSP